MVKLIRVAVAGCGSVSRRCYLPDLVKAPRVRLVAVADADPKAAQAAAREFKIPRWYPSVGRMLAAEPFEMLVNLTSMSAHAAVSLQALKAGKHVWCEKPMAHSLAAARRLMAEARRRKLHFLVAPNSPLSPAFAAAAKAIRSGRLGKVYQIRGRYGWTGPDWSPAFYRKGGGALGDLGVYNITTLTGLMGPARSVTALAGTGTPVRRMHDGRRVRVEAEDNAILLLDFGQARYGVIQTGFVGVKTDDRATIEIIGTKGTLNFLGHDWAPKGIEVATAGRLTWKVEARDQRGYTWENGARDLAACLATGRKPALSAEHAYHVLEIMLGTLRSANTGRRIGIRSTFDHLRLASNEQVTTKSARLRDTQEDRDWAKVGAKLLARATKGDRW